MPNKKTAKEDKGRGERLRLAREAKGLTQKDVADALGITSQAYQNYEYGRELRSSAMVSICTMLNCSPSWLLGIAEEGSHLPDDDPIMVSLRETCRKLNNAGKIKVASYAEDLACNPSYLVEVKKTELPDNSVSVVA